jgi:uncharacterized protein with HEPN domain
VTRDAVYLRHVLDAVDKVANYTAVGRERFLEESMRHDAVIRQLEIIGEAVKGISPELRARNPEIPWQRLAGLRDVLIHRYARVDLDTVWEATGQIAALREAIGAILRGELDLEAAKE